MLGWRRLAMRLDSLVSSSISSLWAVDFPCCDVDLSKNIKASNQGPGYPKEIEPAPEGLLSEQLMLSVWTVTRQALKSTYKQIRHSSNKGYGGTGKPIVAKVELRCKNILVKVLRQRAHQEQSFSWVTSCRSHESSGRGPPGEVRIFIATVVSCHLPR